MFNVGQLAAVRAAFKLAGYEGALRVLRVDSDDERGFVIPSDDFARLRGVDDLTQVLTQLLHCKVWVMAQSNRYPDVPFE